MRNPTKKLVIILVIMIFIMSHLLLALPLFSFAQTSDENGEPTNGEQKPLERNELKERIEAQSHELERINKELEETRSKLDTTRSEKRTLQRDLKLIDDDISHLNLNIKADKITIQKLSLEVDSLNYDIEDIELMMADKKEAVAGVLKKIQRNSHRNLITILLKSGSLAEGVLEAQALADTGFQLSIEVANLENLREDKIEKVSEISDKKKEINRNQKNLENRKDIVDDQKNEKEVILIQTKNKESVYSEQLTELEKRQEEIAAEIEKIEKELREQIDPNLLPISRPGVLLWPVEKVIITQGYGLTEFAKRNYRGKHHNGLDLGGPIGTPILAAEDGRVINVGDQDQYRLCRGGAYGKFIVVKHQNGLSTLYAHLSRSIVSISQEVKKGEIIGYMGKSGWATGPHLHFTVFANNTLTPARDSFPEGTKASRVCGPMPVGGDLDPEQYL